MPNAKDMKRNPGSTREGCGDILGEDDGCKKLASLRNSIFFMLVGCGMFPMVGLNLPECTTGNPNLNLDLHLPMCQHPGGSRGYIDLTVIGPFFSNWPT